MALTVSREELLIDGHDRLFRQVVHDALGFSARLQEIRNQLGAAIGLGGAAYSILIAIEHLSQDGPVGVKRVGDHLHLSGAFVTIEVNKLVQNGLVRKEPDGQDGRRVVLTVTPKTRQLLETLATSQRPVNDTIFAGLDADQFRSFAQIIATLVEGTEEALALIRLQAEQRRRRA